MDLNSGFWVYLYMVEVSELFISCAWHLHSPTFFSVPALPLPICCQNKYMGHNILMLFLKQFRSSNK